MKTVHIITGPAGVISGVRDSCVGNHVVVDVDASGVPDPSGRFGYLVGTDPRVFPAMVRIAPEVVDRVTAIVSAVRGVVDGSPEETYVLVSDDRRGDVVAPAVGDVVAGFLRYIGYETEVAHTGVMELI